MISFANAQFSWWLWSPQARAKNGQDTDRNV